MTSCEICDAGLTPNSDKTACGKITLKFYYCYVLNLNKLCQRTKTEDIGTHIISS